MSRIVSELDLSSDQCIHTLFEVQAAQTPEAVALVCDNREISYHCLNERANQLAHRLVSMGVQPGALVGVSIERSLEVVVSMLGILKAGAAYLPFGTSYPRDRLTFMLEDTGCRVVLISGAVPEALRGRSDVALINLAEGATQNSTGPRYPARSGCGEDLAYLMYTSGSSGQPKGVETLHRGVVRLVRRQDYADLGPGLRTLQISAVSFDAATFEIWAPLLNGGACVIGPAYLPGFDELEHLIRGQQVNCLFLSTGLFNQIVTSRPSVLAGVAHVLTGGDAMSAPHARKFLEDLPATRLTNIYGPTECTTFACAYDIPRDGTEVPERVPIGRPIGQTHCYVLDPELNPVPPGTYGELCIGGDGLARGYLNQPELTARKFVPDPFSSVPGPRLYRSGDECRWRPDGNLEFRGRLDDQIKVREFRIEPGEVETALMRHPGIASAAVIAREGPGGIRSLAAYLVTRNVLAPRIEEIQSEAAKWLPEFMMPSSFTFVGELPLTPNGKVDRRELARIEAKTAGAVQHRKPQTDCEHQLAQIWSSVLERPDIGIDDNFFDLGGHSVLAMRLVSEIDRTFNRRVPVATLFEAPTIAQMAERFEQSKESGTSSPGLRGKAGGAVLIHVPGFHLWGFLPPRVAQRVGTIRRYFDGLQYPGLNGEDPPESVEEFAAHLIPQIEKVAPSGPLSFSGHSFGGIVAYEVARQMREQGRAIELVLLWDSYLPLAFNQRSAAKVVMDMARFVLDPQLAPGRLHYASLRGRRLIGKTIRFVARRKTVAPGAAHPADTAQRKRIADAVVKACLTYRPLPYDGKAVLFQVRQPFRVGLRQAPDALNGWGQFIRGGLEVVHVPGNHLTMVQEPAVRTLADRVYECLLRQKSA